MGIVASVIGMSLFIYVLGFRLKFSRIAVSRKRLQLGSKTDLTTTLLFLEFSVGICLVSSTSCLLGQKSAKIAQSYSFLTPLNLLDSFSCLFLNVPVIFSQRIL